MNYAVRDIVRKIDTYWYGNLGESRDDIGKLYVISEVHGNEYEIRDLVTGSHSAWWNSNQLKYVGRADKMIFDELDAIQNKLHKRNASLEYIKDNYPNLPTGSWLKLFDEIGYDSAFNRNGEYGCLFSDIESLRPVFDAIFDQDLKGAIKKVDEIFKKEYRDIFRHNIERFFDKIRREIK